MSMLWDLLLSIGIGFAIGANVVAAYILVKRYGWPNAIPNIASIIIVILLLLID